MNFYEALCQKYNVKIMANHEKVTLVGNSSGDWDPIFGEESDKLLNGIFEDDSESIEKVREETTRIMRLCGNPEEGENSDTGLVFGYVQSGKTLSFTTLAAMAHDNDYQMVIVIAGVSTNLVNQSYERLQKDLRINQGFKRKWAILNNLEDPRKNPQMSNTIRRELANWRNPKTPQDLRKTILITVLKNTKRLLHLISTLKKLDLRNVATLIIDDEGDQASLNTKASSNAKKAKKGETLSELEMSTIYRRILELKSILPHHTFIQYTATPQAPLFINLMDNLSPNFIQLLTPGEKYTGGKEFFLDNSFIVRRIPPIDLDSDKYQTGEVPESLLEALRFFFLGVAAGNLLGDTEGNPRNRSMMIHPSRLIDGHKEYIGWVRNIKGQWAKLLIDRDEDDESRVKLINEFRETYLDLERNLNPIPGFEDLLNDLGYQISNTAVQELNSQSGSLVTWNSNYSYILVGGQAMDRGFTVEGLTVTYMPRGKGVGNADTLQQRARFFGYKKDYLGYCRVYLDDENIHLFKEYVEHEEDIRKKIAQNNLSGLHLDAMKRQFVLSKMFEITRKNVLSDQIEKKSYGNRWVSIKAPHDKDFIITHNRTIRDSFVKLNMQSFKEDIGHIKRTSEQVHLEAKLSLRSVYDEFLSKLIFTRQSDSGEFTGLRVFLELYLQKSPSENCKVVLMKKGVPRERSLNKKEEILNLFQGKNPKSGEEIYPGDIKIKEPELVSIQIHTLNIKGTEYRNVVTIVVWIPERMSKSLVQKKSNV